MGGPAAPQPQHHSPLLMVSVRDPRSTYVLPESVNQRAEDLRRDCSCWDYCSGGGVQELGGCVVSKISSWFWGPWDITIGDFLPCTNAGAACDVVHRVLGKHRGTGGSGGRWGLESTARAVCKSVNHKLPIGLETYWRRFRKEGAHAWRAGGARRLVYS